MYKYLVSIERHRAGPAFPLYSTVGGGGGRVCVSVVSALGSSVNKCLIRVCVCV